MLNQQLIFVPCLILIITTFLVLITMFSRRIKYIKSGKIKPSHFKTHDTDQKESAKTVQAQRNFANLQEAPPIFYILCLITYVTGNVNELMIGLSWAFLIFRLVHTLIHITSNKLPARMFSFALSWLVVIVMSAILIIKVI
ncbi:MAPEG family protein [Halobacteriovorax sp.]|uniref:MAPEG family protein n=1 Tax=Halobacteriovorax sp. TaxID=2020862 RepID=UPI0035696032